jgi:hypothetical protein
MDLFSFAVVIVVCLHSNQNAVSLVHTSSLSSRQMGGTPTAISATFFLSIFGSSSTNDLGDAVTRVVHGQCQ